jgi:chemotaxis protein methyltransferase CheR
MSLTETDFRFVAGLVRQRSSINLQPGKEYLVEARLAPVARRHGDRNLNALVGRLRAGDAALTAVVVDALTSNETSFFRDAYPFDSFVSTLLPTVAERASGSELNIWSAACSSGQEAYSLAILVLDWAAANPGVQVRIFGTDVSRSMIERARSGSYTQLEINRGLTVQNLVKYFVQSGRDWTLRQKVRDLTSFTVANLALPPVGVPPCDIVFLRNVLIYFDLETKRAVMENVRKVLRRGGYLVLGGSESPLDLDDVFKRVEIDKFVAFRHEGGAS